MEDYSIIIQKIEELESQMAETTGADALGELTVALNECYSQLVKMAWENGYDGYEDMVEDLEFGDKSIPRTPKHTISYENADADGNRGQWMDFYECKTCGCELDYHDFDNGRCKACGQKIDTDGDGDY